NWIPGIIGLVAGRICEEYHLPAVVISEGEFQSKGSARSVDGIDIIETIRRCSDILIDVGGHPKAAGFSLETTKLKVFKNRIEEIFEKIKVNTVVESDFEAVIDLKKVDK